MLACDDILWLGMIPRCVSHLKSLPVTLTLEHVSPVTRLLEKRKQMLHVQESLDAQKEEYTRKEEIFKVSFSVTREGLNKQTKIEIMRMERDLHGYAHS